MTAVREGLLPIFGLSNREYMVGNKCYHIILDPKAVFPPSETTLALAEAISGLNAERALDAGTGSGLLAITLADGACREVWAIDKNDRATKCAGDNAKRNGVRGKMQLLTTDFLTWRPLVRFDLIVSNPPFMPVPAGSSFISDEIDLAINGGQDGVESLIAFGKKAAALLSRNGRLLLAVPRFTWHARVEAELGKMFAARLLHRKTIRYWLAEHAHKYKKHIHELAETGRADIKQNGDVVKADLMIIEYTPKYAPTR